MPRHAATVAILLFLLPVFVFAQEFDFQADHTDTTAPLNSVYTFDCSLVNNGDATETYSLVKVDLELPENWETALCFAGGCYPSFVDTVSDTVAAGDDEEVLVEFYLGTFEAEGAEGTGTMLLKIFCNSDPSIRDSVEFTVTSEENRVTAPGNSSRPLDFALAPVYPNPFNSSAKVEFSLPVAGEARIMLVDLNGREISVLLQESLPAGRHTAYLEAAPRMASGMYLVRLEAMNRVAVRKAMYLK